ncbi:hypothetical protein DFH09DRAFT_1077679 [Mycena vulgaris]|nr:hypothetical protein DFH09DRAFT_1077679 [Mycena vulgaris]
MSSDARNLPPFRLKLPGLTILWVNRARHLAQALLRVSIIQRFDELPPDMMVLTHKFVRLLLDNMVTLGKASVKYGPYRDRFQPDFFVPSEATTLFGLAEGFVDLFGFEGDEDAARQRAIFGNLELLYSGMLLNPLYTGTGVNFPGFHVDIRTLVLFGVTPWIKPSQLARVLPGSRAVRHNFGDNLLCYQPELGEAGRFVLALGDEDYALTQLNTPELESRQIFSCWYYGREEFAEIWYWMERVFLHLRLLLLSHCDMSSQYSGGWGLPSPSACKIPGEATAMFEILYHLCLSVGSLDIQGMELPINRHMLLPLICKARRTRAHFKMPVDFQPYNSFGGLDDPSFLTLEGW